MIFRALPLGEWHGRGPGLQALNHMSFLHGKELTTWLGSRRPSTVANGLGADILLLDISNGSPVGARPNATLSHPSAIAEREPEDDRLSGDRILG